MESQEQIFQRLIRVENVSEIPQASLLGHLASLIDISTDLKREDGLAHAVRLISEVDHESLESSSQCVLDYYTANAWAELGQIRCDSDQSQWEWQQEELEKEITYLRRAAASVAFDEMPAPRRCQVLTNLGNALSNVGRVVEALECWSKAIQIEPRFGMAVGNRGQGLFRYARAIDDSGHRITLLREAARDLRHALTLPLYAHAKGRFTEILGWIDANVPPNVLERKVDLNGATLGSTNEERSYRAWCMTHGLFLNSLNDLGPYTASAHDCLYASSIVGRAGEGPFYHGFFNQIKQEYVTARFLLFESTQMRGLHFGDTGVRLFDTLDSPVYSIRAEKAKLAFRSLYSLLDKMAFFLNRYIELGIPDHRVSFRTLWFNEQKFGNGLRPELKNRENWPLRGLYWLSKDLHEETDLTASLEPDAKRIAEIRNHLEHKYLKLHSGAWSKTKDIVLGQPVDSMAYSMEEQEFNGRALKLVRLVRAAVIYLSLAIKAEESKEVNGNLAAEKVIEIRLRKMDDSKKL